MANSIEYAKRYLPILDEVYKNASCTAVLEGNGNVMPGVDEDTFYVWKLDMDALGDFTRGSGYSEGNTILTKELIKNDKERSQVLRVDRLDNQESMDMAFGKLGSEFIRTKVVPETDAARISKIAGTTGVTTKKEVLASAADTLAALRVAANQMDEDEVPTDSRVLFITPSLIEAIADIDTTKSKAVLSRFSNIVKVPQSRMFTNINLKTGAKNVNGALSSNFGFAKSENSKDINFLIVEKGAVAVGLRQYLKYFTPDQDQIGDDNVFKYRNNNLYGYVYENKTTGVYVSINDVEETTSGETTPEVTPEETVPEEPQG